jgi:hypothetical protein
MVAADGHPCLYTALLPNPFISKDSFRAPSPGPCEYNPKYPRRAVKSVVLPTPDKRTVPRKAAGPVVDQPGPGSYMPKIKDHVPTPRIEPPAKKELRNPGRLIAGPHRKQGQKAMPATEDLPGPGSYSPRMAKKGTPAPVFDHIGADCKGPSGDCGPPKATRKAEIPPDPGPATYTPRAPKKKGSIPWAPPVYDPQEAQRRFEAYKGAQSRTRRPWREPCISD